MAERRRMKYRRKLFIGLLLTVTFMLTGTAGYALIEHYSFLDAFYMTVITITTVGFGEVHTLSEAGRIFTIILILLGFGSIGFLAHTFTEALVERAASGNMEKRTMQKRIRDLKDHVIICGYGRVGEAATEHLASTGTDFVVIENDENQLKLIAENHFTHLHGDATREDTLLAAGIKQANGLLALLNSDPENLFTVLTARELNPTLHIIARTEMATSESRMLRAGADSIISPYAAAGRSVAEKMLKLSGLMKEVPISLSGIDQEPVWTEVTPQSDLAGHVVDTANTFLESKIVGIQRGDTDILMPHPEEEILLGDRLLTVSICRPHISAYSPKNASKIVLVDDNPVIRRLYTRLFQRSGFHIITAADGTDGLAKIFQEKPDGAIIDDELPDISGIDLCRRLRASGMLKGIRLILFTKHKDMETKNRALAAGADSIVIKSPDATEIVRAVQKILQQAPAHHSDSLENLSAVGEPKQ